jgi:hypothetical protein
MVFGAGVGAAAASVAMVGGGKDAARKASADTAAAGTDAGEADADGEAGADAGIAAADPYAAFVSASVELRIFVQLLRIMALLLRVLVRFI